MDHTQYTTKWSRTQARNAFNHGRSWSDSGYEETGTLQSGELVPALPSRTISNELKRGTPPRTGSRGRAPGYSAKRGDAVYKENRKNSHKPHRIDKCTSFVQWVVTQVRTEKVVY